MAAKIKFFCACGKKLSADPSTAGRKAKCPGCGQVVRVPQSPAEKADYEADLGLPPIADLPPVGAPPLPSNFAAASVSQASPPIPPPPSPLSGPPPLPGAAGQAVKSIWDEEDEYRLQAPPDVPCPKCGTAMPSHAVLCMACGYNRQTQTPASQPATLPPVSRQSLFSGTGRTRQGRKMGSIKLPIGLLVAGAVVLVLGIKEKKLTDASSREPEQISLARLIERGPEGNANIILTDYKICPNIVFEKKTVGGQMVGEWTKVWVPIVRPNLLGLGAAAQAAAGNEIHALIFSTHVANEGELVGKLAHPPLRGLVTNRIKSLSAKEKELLQQGYPGIDCDRCLIIDEGRAPTSSELILLYLGGGGLLLLAGIGLLGLRVFGR